LSVIVGNDVASAGMSEPPAIGELECA